MFMFRNCHPDKQGRQHCKNKRLQECYQQFQYCDEKGKRHRYPGNSMTFQYKYQP